MTRKGCGKKKHTPIVSEAQRRLFGAVLSGTAKKAKGLSKAEAKSHLKEAKGKDLPEKSDFLDYVNSRKHKGRKAKK